jgi:hypothetical protein
MAKNHTDTRQQLSHAERFGDVVVSAFLERHERVRLAVARREYDDRYSGPSAESVTDFEAVPIRQGEFQDHDVWSPLRDEFQAACGGGGHGELERGGRKPPLKGAPDRPLAIDQQQASAGTATRGCNGGNCGVPFGQSRGVCQRCHVAAPVNPSVDERATRNDCLGSCRSSRAMAVSCCLQSRGERAMQRFPAGVAASHLCESGRSCGFLPGAGRVRRFQGDDQFVKACVHVVSPVSPMIGAAA